MPASRAVRHDVHHQGLDPATSHSQLDKHGRLRFMHVEQPVPSAEERPVEAVSAPEPSVAPADVVAVAEEPVQQVDVTGPGPEPVVPAPEPTQEPTATTGDEKPSKKKAPKSPPSAG